MKTRIYLAALTCALFAGSISYAQTATQTATPAATPPGTRPPNATGICKDGTFSLSAAKTGACRGHHGVQEWYTVAASAPATPAASTPLPAPTPAAAPSPTTQARTQNQAAAQSAGQSATPPATTSLTAPASQTAPSTSSAKKGSRASLASIPVAPGGGPGLVWVNTASNVYHCPGTDYYGKTKAGSYMSEADAKAKGVHGVRGKTCSK